MAGRNADNAIFKCPTCQALLWTLEELEAHSPACYQPPPQPTPFKCYVPLCLNRHFLTELDLFRHFNREHRGGSCEDCHRWLNHSKQHRDPCNRYKSPRFCEICNIGFATNDAYDWHIKCHNFKCIDHSCSFLTFRSRGDLEKDHIDFCHRPKHGNLLHWQCLSHPDDFLMTIAMGHAHQAMHKGRYGCPYCSSTYVYHYLLKHIRENHYKEEQESMVYGPECQKTTAKSGLGPFFFVPKLTNDASEHQTNQTPADHQSQMHAGASSAHNDPNTAIHAGAYQTQGYNQAQAYGETQAYTPNLMAGPSNDPSNAGQQGTADIKYDLAFDLANLGPGPSAADLGYTGAQTGAPAPGAVGAQPHQHRSNELPLLSEQDLDELLADIDAPDNTNRPAYGQPQQQTHYAPSLVYDQDLNDLLADIDAPDHTNRPAAGQPQQQKYHDPSLVHDQDLDDLFADLGNGPGC